MVQPVAMVADAIMDCTRRNDLVLDPFLGIGTTIIASERTGRGGFGMDVEPLCVDATVQRWQAFTGQNAVHAATGKTFAASAAEAGASHAA